MEPRDFALDYVAAVSQQGVQESVRALREVVHWMPPPARLLDIGCATGSKLLAAKQVGYQVAGVEISPYAAEFARRQGFNVFTGELESAPFAEQSWDVILCHHVLEHLPRPSRLIRRCFELLRPGGILVVEVPDFGSLPARGLLMGWPHFKPMEHIHYFERPSLARLLAGQGFRILRFRRDGLLAVFEMWPFARRKQSPIQVRLPSSNPEKSLLARAMGAFKHSLNRMPRVAQTMERVVFQLAPIHDFLRVYAVRE
jgi:SAM-dependent methyltransferase